jgi:hypothetical protein
MQTTFRLAALSLAAAVGIAIPSGPARGETALEGAVPESALSKLAVKEITVFKDGHAFVLHEGTLPTDDEGNVHMDYLPTPVIGTFWPYSADKDVPLTGVVAGKSKVNIERTALSVRELLEANVGAKVLIKEGQHTYAATIVGIPERGAEELLKLNPAVTPPEAGGPSYTPGEVIILKTAEGYKVIGIATIQDVTFLEEPKTRLSREEYRNLLTLKMAWPEDKAKGSAEVGMMYLQKGVRWIPHYKVEIDGKGNALVRLQATILNEMTDLENVTANLVIGVPSFYFKDTIDPIALAQAAAQLSPYFDSGAQTQFALSNSMMTQVARMGEHRIARIEDPAVDLGPDVDKGDKREDLFIFTVKDLSVKKGERVVVPIVEFSLPYKDVYTLEVPMVPPPQIRQQFNDQQQQELAALFHAPKVMHKLRLSNSSGYPLTTCPATIVQEDRLLGQGLMTYTAMGASVDLAVTQAIDIQVKKTEDEVERTPNAANWGGYAYDRINLKGEITLTNHRGSETEIHVTRYVLGNVDEADSDGKIRALNIHEEGWNVAGGLPSWWSWYGWPVWWHQLNRASRIDWDVKLEDGKSATLKYEWHYFWRN